MLSISCAKRIEPFENSSAAVRLRLNDDQRRRLAGKAKRLGRKMLTSIATIVTPETLLAWRRKLIAEKYNGSSRRAPGRPKTVGKIEPLVVKLATENRDCRVRKSLEEEELMTS